MDVIMPEMNGYEATMKICKHYEKKNRPRIIVMTADVMNGDKEKCFAAGMDDYVCKPIIISELISVLEKTTSFQLVEEPKS